MENNKDKEKNNKSTDSVRRLNIYLIQYFHIIALLIVVAFIVLGILFVLKPKYDAIQVGIDISNDNMKKEQESLEKYNTKLDGYIASFESLKEKNKDDISTFLPDSALREDLFLQFEEIAARDGLLLTSLTIDATDVDSILNPKPNAKTSSSKKGDTSLPPGIGSAVINISLVGISYDGMKNFLREIETNMRLMDINDISFNNDGQSLSLKITTYFNYFELMKK